MPDQKQRSRSQPNRSQEWLRGRDDQPAHGFDSGPDTPSRRNRSDTAEDGGLDRERRNAAGPLEGDQLETGRDENHTADTRNTDDEEGLGGFGRSER